jgi:hypothetical protein
MGPLRLQDSQIDLIHKPFIVPGNRMRRAQTVGGVLARLACQGSPHRGLPAVGWSAHPRTSTHQKSELQIRSFLAHFLLSNGAIAVSIQIPHRLKALITRGCL